MCDHTLMGICDIIKYFLFKNKKIKITGHNEFEHSTITEKVFHNKCSGLKKKVMKMNFRLTKLKLMRERAMETSNDKFLGI